MASLEYDDGHWKMEVIYNSTDLLTIVNPPVRVFIISLRELHNKVNLSLFEVIKNIDNTFTYRFTATDGRVWEQVVRQIPEDFEMNFNVDDYFTLKEFEPHRTIRLQVLELIENFNLEKIQVDFL